jgi:hypothetical protein
MAKKSEREHEEELCASHDVAPVTRLWHGTECWKGETGSQVGRVEQEQPESGLRITNY